MDVICSLCLLPKIYYIGAVLAKPSPFYQVRSTH